ncbi:MAG: hypothetical protein L6R45_19605 [Anaerolineae bacterium]|nr:hypothetical protein [Anaerolineae bacterium]
MKTLSRLIALFGLILSLGVGFSLLLMLSVKAEAPITSLDASPPIFPDNPLLAPAPGVILADFRPGFDWADAVDPEGSPISYTLVITGPVETLVVTTTDSHFIPTTYLANGFFSWTVRTIDAAGNASVYQPPFTFTIQATWRGYLPIVVKAPPPVCPINSDAVYSLIPVDNPPADHPDYLHGDLNLSLRDYNLTTGAAGLVDYSGSSDSGAPQLASLFEPNNFLGINAVYRVNSWNWACGAHGCPGPAITNPPVTLISLRTSPGEPIYIPERSADIYGGGYKALVLYAEEQRITLGYVRQDTVANGYAVHLENICVDPNLLALYQSRVNASGMRIVPVALPALRNNQALGTALSDEIGVAIRDRGAFMDPRSRKDWWRGY